MQETATRRQTAMHIKILHKFFIPFLIVSFHKVNTKVNNLRDTFGAKTERLSLVISTQCQSRTTREAHYLTNG